MGDLFLTTRVGNPATLLGYGTWALFGPGRALVCVDEADPDFGSAGAESGAKTVTLDATQIPAHTHAVTDPGHSHLTQRYPTATGGSSGFTADTSMSGTPADNTLATKAATTGITLGQAGGGQPHSNVQPSKAAYIWLRTA